MKNLIRNYPFLNVVIKELAIEKKRKQTILVVVPISFAILLIFPLIIEGRSFVSSEIIGTYHIVLSITLCLLFATRSSDNNFEIRKTNKFGDITASEHFLGKTISEISILFPALIIFDYLTIALTNHPIQSTVTEYLIFTILFSICICSISIYVNFISDLDTKLIQILILSTIFIPLGLIMTPIWLGVSPELTSIYMLMFIGVALILVGFSWITNIKRY
ncbi:MAG: hypothetical protein VYD26_03655 [Actinomycetota bacterium]|nr:hypothetical protein [Actinomycetota bacterium]|tara:strand:+ start:2208 stop:2864 length:657 start_codon:yes stop_codon:yes gene_type:complete